MIYSEDAWQVTGPKNLVVVVSPPSSFLLFYGFCWGIAVKVTYCERRE
jgi:hypothetical protein